MVSSDHWLPNEGVHTLEYSSVSAKYSSRLYLLCFETLPTGSRWEYILSFDCESEQANRVPLPIVVGDPILCSLQHKLCCAAFLANFLRIHQFVENGNIWIILIDHYAKKGFRHRFFISAVYSRVVKSIDNA
jgi:hypothetical protein